MTAQEANWEMEDPCSPGEILQEELEERGISPGKFSKITGIQLSKLNLVLNGSGPLTMDIATRLQAQLSVPASVWVELERRYREAVEEADELGETMTELDSILPELDQEEEED